MNFFKKNWTHLKNFIIFIIERIFCILLILIIFAVLIFFLLQYSTIINPQAVEAQQINICGISLENLETIFTSSALIVTAFWSMHQYNKNKTSKQQEKASEIAKSFSNALTTKCFIICEVIKNSDLYPLLEHDKKTYNSFKSFTTNEIRSVYNDDRFFEKYRTTKKLANLDQIYYKILESRISDNDFKTLKSQNKQYSSKDAEQLFKLNNSNFPFKFKALVSDVLNELEYLCMSLSSQAAGSKYVYQSLHQVFLRTIRILSIEIAMSNDNNYSDKHYTSIIYVYNEWTQLYMQNLKKENKLKEKINNILEPKIKTV